ncbi:hypothetical protein BB560_002802 [Smittium megazygosporum]|uniref:tRNA (guanine(26)-N(2))-dimethyltransferase n=1 Tax=Smittium megazygosporum TaxID=133381 RepID=A0A2T9ZDQ7_9FUNG|nr:hypothetical protein BB560_002802 [Smittium megazygosporum]
MKQENIEYKNQKYVKITEGKATILIPEGNEVFYNPIQEFNRDMSIAAINTWRAIYAEEKRNDHKLQTRILKGYTSQKTEEITILEALAASGLRSMRYAKEIDHVESILVNDFSEEAVRSIVRNAEYNSIPDTVIKANHGDAMDVLYNSRSPSKQFDVVDLDPYGSPSRFIDGAVQAVRNGGLLCITATDMSVLASNNNPDTAFMKYGSVTMRSNFCHEFALRILLNYVQQTAARYERYIVPLMSCSIDFYIRVFVRVFDSAEMAKKAVVNTALVLNCPGCSSFVSQPLGKKSPTRNGFKYSAITGPNLPSECTFCGSRMVLGGPCYIGAIQNTEFASKMYSYVEENKNEFTTRKRMLGMIKVIEEEIDVPFHYTLSSLCSAVKANALPYIKLRSAILNSGYKVSSAHSCTASIKTDAPPELIWDIMRTYSNSIENKKEIPSDSIPAKILSVSPSHEVSFETHKDATPTSKKLKLVRYQVNPEKYWGPKSKHKTLKRKAEDAPQPETAAS